VNHLFKVGTHCMATVAKGSMEEVRAQVLQFCLQTNAIPKATLKFLDTTDVGRKASEEEWEKGSDGFCGGGRMNRWKWKRS